MESRKLESKSEEKPQIIKESKEKKKKINFLKKKNKKKKIQKI